MSAKIKTTFDLGGGARIEVGGDHVIITRQGTPAVSGTPYEWMEFCDAVLTDRGVGVRFKRMALYRDGGEFVTWNPDCIHDDEPIRVGCDKMHEAVPFILGAFAALAAIAKDGGA